MTALTDSPGSTPLLIVFFCDKGGGNYRGALLSLALVVAAVAIDLVLVITLLAIGALYVTVSTYWCFTEPGTVIFVRVITIITLLARVDTAITTSSAGDYLAM
jgi:fumarate reductase subunit C